MLHTLHISDRKPALQTDGMGFYQAEGTTKQNVIKLQCGNDLNHKFWSCNHTKVFPALWMCSITVIPFKIYDYMVNVINAKEK